MEHLLDAMRDGDPKNEGLGLMVAGKAYGAGCRIWV